MKTYLTIMFSSEGSSPSEVTNRLSMLGFKPLTGQWDFVYEWDKSADVQDAIFFGDKITQVLKGQNVMFKIETI